MAAPKGFLCLSGEERGVKHPGGRAQRFWEMPVPCLHVCESPLCLMVCMSEWDGLAAYVGRDGLPHTHFSQHGCYGAF